MRFLSVIEIKHICHVARESALRRNVVHFRGLRDPFLYQAHIYRRGFQSSRGEEYGIISSVGNFSPYGECLSKVLRSSKLPLATGRWNNIRKEFEKVFISDQVRSDYLASFRMLVQARGSRMSGQGSGKLFEATRNAVARRPATIAGLADSKGQVAVRFFGLLLGGSFLFKDMSVPTAEQLHGKMVINSMDPQRLSFGALTIAYFSKTVETLLLLSRAVYLLALFMPALILAPFADHFGGQVRIYWLQILLSTLENAGPAFIKWGQWAATRPDIFPQDVCGWLSKLHMQAPAHTFQQTRKICEKAFRARLEDIFEEFSEEPVASGSIAQVHRAILKQKQGNGIPGQVVAVKVRHPGLTKLIQRDFVIIKWLARVSTVIPGLHHLQLDKTVQQFASFMTKQVDLTLEAAHLLRFIYNFRKSRNVFFPVPVYPLVHPGVLVETYEEGQSISNFVDLTTHLTPTHTKLAYIGSSALLKMLLAFARDVDLKFKEYLSIRGTAKNTGECMTELFDQVRKHRVNIDGDVCTVMVTTLILEGWQRKLDPDLDIITMVGDLLLKQDWQVPYDYAISAIAAP